VRRLVSILLLCLVACGVASAAGSKGNYTGAARSLAPTAAQAKYKAVTGESAAARPPADTRKGWRDGWQIAYLKGTAAKPLAAVAVIYVYRTTADARHAFANACKDCSKTYRTQGVSMRFRLTSQKSANGAIAVATCRNVYVAALTSGKAATNTLLTAAGALVGNVFALAMAGGMSPCKTA
jgi:hypothetical protein